MVFTQWSDALKAGLSGIDQQYRHLVEQTQLLCEAMAGELDHEPLSRLLHGLLDYSQDHFRFEQTLLVRLGHPGSEAHRAEHVRFTSQVESLLARHENHEEGGLEALALLKNWLAQHSLPSQPSLEESPPHGMP